MDVVNPLSIILVKSDSKGDRLLFRYPYHDHNQQQHRQKHYHHHTKNTPTNCYGPAASSASASASTSSRRSNPYAVRDDGTGPGGHGPEDILQSPPPQTSNIVDGQLCGFTDEVLSTLFAVKPELCNRKFELKVNDVRFVAHPTLMQQSQLGMQTPQPASQQQQPFTSSNFNKDAEDRSSCGTATATTLSSASSLSPPVIVIVAQPSAPAADAAANSAPSNKDGPKNHTDEGTSSSSTVSPQQASAATNNSASASSASPSASAASAAAATANSNVPASGTTSSSILINIVFALHAQASYSIVKCYYELSKRLGHALVYEEKRVGYLSDEMRLMVKTHDEQPICMLMATHGDGDPPTKSSASSMSASASSGGAAVLGVNSVASNGGDMGGGGLAAVGNSPALAPSAFDLILERSTLAQCLKSIYHDLCTTGLLNTTINQWVTLSFCLPQKAHQFHKRGVVVEPEAIDRCLQSLKPYHGMLLLVDLNELLDCFPPSGARMLLQLLNAYNPLKTLQNMAAEADLAIQHVYELVGHLVYWAKATIIYPLCETNVYVIAPDAPLHSQSPLVDKFSAKFPGMSLFEVISDFSLPTSIGHLTTPLQHPTRQGTLAQMVLWMLQHHLLMQLHTYVQFMPTEHGECNSNSISRIGAGGLSASTNGGQPVDKEDNDYGHVLSELIISPSLPTMPAPNTNGSSFADDRTSTISDADDDDDDNDDDLAIESETIDCAALATNQHQFRVARHSPVTFCSSNDTNTTTTSTNTTTSTANNTSANTTAESGESADSLAGSVEDEDRIKELLLAFREPERSAVRDLSAASNADDLALMVKLWQAGYFKGEHHLEEIMYFENLRRSQLLQLLDKFRDVLIIYETEDPAIATLYTQTVE